MITEEYSSLNDNWIDPITGELLCSTATEDQSSLSVTSGSTLPNHRTKPKIYVMSCDHDYKFIESIQMRSGDEAATSIFQCTKCKSRKTG